DDEDFAYKLYLGLELPGPLAVEGGYRELGRVTGDGGLLAATAESDGFDAYLLGKLPLGPVAIFAKGGVIAWDTEVRTTAPEGSGLPDIRVTNDGTDFAWGVGLSFEIGKVSLRGEYEKFEIDLPDDVSMLSVGVAYEF
ncbi:MAG: outer membrane beta-barrel protein, partial [Thermoanaerobaculia bacterium]|nr:outer membrane beta-barrel protein [Thermoanaerobaculia bacterium]